MKWLILLLPIFAFAESQNLSCANAQIDHVDSEVVGPFDLTVSHLGGTCSVTFSLDSDEPYRTFTYYDNGRFDVYNAWPGQRHSRSSGMRSYMFFPNETPPRVYANEETGEAYLEIGSGERIYFDFNTGRINNERTTTMDITEEEEISNDNRGGVRIYNSQALRFEFGYQMGRSPLTNTSNSFTIVDPSNKSCRVKINDVFQIECRQRDYSVIIDQNCRGPNVESVTLQSEGQELINLIKEKSPDCEEVDLSLLMNSQTIQQLEEQTRSIAEVTSPPPVDRSLPLPHINNDEINNDEFVNFVVDEFIPRTTPVSKDPLRQVNKKKLQQGLGQ